MVRHIVMWKFKEDCEQQIREFLDALMDLYGKIEVIRDMEVGINIEPENEYNAVLVATFDSMEDLNKYKTDPRHVAAASLHAELRISRKAIDYEI